MSGIRSITRRAAQVGFATAVSAPIRVDATTGLVTVNGAGSGSTETTLVDTNSAQVLTNKSSVAPLISGSGATVTLTAAQSGSTILFDRAAGIVYTLPAPALGLNFSFLVTTAITSNSAKVITDAGTTLLLGSVWEAVAAGTGTQFFSAPTTSIAVTQNGTTTGGLIGSALYLTCVDATHWMVDGTLVASGTIATPFANS
jgi:hypothetical protein